MELGKPHKGYWQRVKPGWRYACGEFGTEGLDPVRIMRKYYPKDWLPRSRTEENQWSPTRIRKAQTGQFHYMWFETQHTLADWVRVSQRHQAWATRIMTEAFRRDNRMVSFAIHLFIDAFPAGWRKVRKLAGTVAAMSGAGCFRDVEPVTPLGPHVKIDWNMFWLHSLFTARLTDRLANVFRPTSGKEYLAGLPHDVGKLFMEGHFPREFETATLRAIERHIGLYECEKQDTQIAGPGYCGRTAKDPGNHRCAGRGF